MKQICVLGLLCLLLAACQQSPQPIPISNPTHAATEVRNTALSQPQTTVARDPTATQATAVSSLSAPAVPTQVTRQSEISQTVDATWGMQLLIHDQPDVAVLRLRELGLRWVRVGLIWSLVESQVSDPPNYDWTKFDNLFKALHEAGISSIVEFTGNPDNVAQYSCGPLNVGQAAKLERFLQEAVARYVPLGASYWEIYNEPDNFDLNNRQGGCFGKTHAQDYVDTLKTAYTAIKAANPQAQVVLGGLGFERFDGSPFDEQFFETILKLGAGNYVDVLNFHFYPAFAYNWEEYGVDLGGKANAIRKLMAQYNVRKPLMLTEVGTPTAGPDKVGYSEAKTARYLVQAFTRAAGSNMVLTTWYTLSDQSGDLRLYGLINADGSPKLPYRAFQTLNQDLKGTAFGRALSTQERGSKEVEGYLFTPAEANGAAESGTKIVAWANNEGSYAIRLQATQATVTDLTGQASSVQDGKAGDGDGKADGVIQIRVGLDPVFVSAKSDQ